MSSRTLVPSCAATVRRRDDGRPVERRRRNERDDRRSVSTFRVRLPKIDAFLRRENGAAIDDADLDLASAERLDRIRRAADLENRYRPRGMARVDDRTREIAGDRCDRCDLVREIATEIVREGSTVREPGRIHALPIDRIAPRKIRDKSPYEADIIRADVLWTAIVPAAGDAFGVDDDKSEFVAQSVEMRELF
jgi:hypothetical protein